VIFHACRKLLKVDAAKVGKIFDHLRACGLLLVRKPSDPDANDTTRPPGEDAAATVTSASAEPLSHPTANGTSLQST
jgi:hypothetical protein